MKTQTLIGTIIFFIFALVVTNSPAQPILDWSKTYNGGSGFTDKAIAMTLDNDCNTYVIGQSDSIGQGIDIVTIKYDMDGAIIWKNRWDGSDHLDDIPTDIHVDSHGNVFVCGRTQGAATSFDFVVIKYTSDGLIASGLWPVTYNYSGTNGNGFDGAENLCLNSATGNVYVTGESTNHYSSVSQEDIMTIRYDSLGNILDSAIIGNMNNRDYARQIGFDHAGMLFLLIYDSFGNYTTYKYDQFLSLIGIGGNNNFGNLHQPTEFGIDVSNNRYYGMDQTNGFRIVKIDPTNFNVWSRDFRKTVTSIDEIKSLVVENSGNSYVAASSTNTSGESDLWLLKINTSGDTVWTRTWGVSNNANETPVKIIGISSPSGIVVVGNSVASGVSKLVTLKLDTAGNILNNYPLLFNTSTDFATDATNDSYGNLFVSGYSGNPGSEDFLTLKYRTNNFHPTMTSVNGDSLYVLPIASSYQWYKGDSLLVGETNQGITIDTIIYGNGNYHCEVVQYCSRYYSDTLAATTVGINNMEVSDNIFSLINNYDENVVEILFKTNVSKGNLRIYDLLGHLIYSEVVNNLSIGERKQILFSNSPGIYFLKIKNEGIISIKKFLHF